MHSLIQPSLTAGHYSTSVPKKTFQRGMVASLFLCSSAYLIPVLVATGATDISQDDWKPGTFAVAGTQIAGRWLGNWIVLSSAICAIGSFCSELAAGECLIDDTFTSYKNIEQTLISTQIPCS